MRSRATFLGHAVHPVMIVLPLGLFNTAVILDIAYLITGRAGFAAAAGYVIGTGLVSGLAAAVFGLMDWTAIPPGTPAKRVGLLHGAGNVLVLLLFTASWLLRIFHQWVPSPAALICGFAGLALAGVTGWLGGELVERLGVGINDGVASDAGWLDGRSSLLAPATVAPTVPRQSRRPRHELR